MNILSILAWKDALTLERISINSDTITLEVTTNTLDVNCPSCGQHSSSVHSHYQRHVADLPLASWMTKVVLNAKKFRCRNPDCLRKIFCERPRGAHLFQYPSTIGVLPDLRIVSIRLPIN